MMSCTSMSCSDTLMDTFLIATSSATMSRISSAASFWSSCASWARSMVFSSALKMVIFVAW